MLEGPEGHLKYPLVYLLFSASEAARRHLSETTAALMRVVGQANSRDISASYDRELCCPLSSRQVLVRSLAEPDKVLNMLLSVVRRASSLFNLMFPLAFLSVFGWFAYPKIVEPALVRAAVINTAPSLGGKDEPAAATAPTIPNRWEPPAQTVTRPGDNSLVAVGDTLQVAFYERLINEEDKWSARSFSQRPAISFQQRTELSGEYEVHEDGSVIIPLLGAFPVAGRSVAQFEGDAKKAFEQLVGRFAFMSITINHRPVYVVGPVKKPGYYKFTEGLTVYHIVALAGGFEHTSVELDHMLQAIHEVETKQKTGDRLKRLWAKLNVLEAERDRIKAAPSRDLLRLCSESEAFELIASESSVRRLALRNSQAQADSISASLQSARDELQSHQKLQDQIQSGILVRTQRLADLDSLGDKIGRPFRSQVEAELGDTKARIQETAVALHAGEAKVSQLEKDKLTFENQAKIDLQQQIVDLRAQISEASSTTSASAGALDAMRTALAINDDGTDGATMFQIVRGPRANRQIINATGMEAINPGDLVRVLVNPPASKSPM